MTDASEDTKGVESLKNFERALGHVRNSVRPLTLMSREEVGTCVSAADRAKLNLQVAYGVSSLFYMFLKTQGVSPTGHPVKAELERIREKFGRLKRVGKPPEKRTLKVDVDASRRFIDAALSGDGVWQNAKGTDSKRAQEKRAAAGIGRSNPAGQPEILNNTLEAAAAVLGGGGAPSSGGGRTATGRQRQQEQRRQQQQEQQRQEQKQREEIGLLPGAPGGGGGGGSGSKRKHAPTTTTAEAAMVKGSAGGGGSGGGGEKNKGDDRTEPVAAGGSPRAAKKTKSSGGKKKKKAAQHRSW